MKEHFTYQSSFDGLPLDVLIIAPNHPKAIIQFSHGMCEHKERYLDFIQYLNKNGYACIIHDHRGHGKSIKHPDDLGYFYKDGDKAIVEDLHELTLLIKQRYPKLPLYLFGHSMGSLVVRCYIKKYDQDIDGLIICGSPSYNPLALTGKKLAHFISSIKGDHYHSLLIKAIGFDSFNKRFDKNIANGWICSNKEVVDAYNQNPLCAFTFTTNGFEALFSLMNETYNKSSWQFKNKHLPIHFIAGKEDPCIQNIKQFNKAVSFIKAIGYTHVTSHLFDNMRHEILNETHKDIVYKHILDIFTAWTSKNDD